MAAQPNSPDNMTFDFNGMDFDIDETLLWDIQSSDVDFQDALFGSLAPVACTAPQSDSQQAVSSSTDSLLQIPAEWLFDLSSLLFDSSALLATNPASPELSFQAAEVPETFEENELLLMQSTLLECVQLSQQPVPAPQSAASSQQEAASMEIECSSYGAITPDEVMTVAEIASVQPSKQASPAKRTLADSERWSEELLTMPVVNFNRYIRYNDLDPLELRDLRLARRRVKNRGYSQDHRNRVKASKSVSLLSPLSSTSVSTDANNRMNQLEKTNAQLKAEIEQLESNMQKVTASLAVYATKLHVVDAQHFMAAHMA